MVIESIGLREIGLQKRNKRISLSLKNLSSTLEGSKRQWHSKMKITRKLTEAWQIISENSKMTLKSTNLNLREKTKMESNKIMSLRK